MQISNDIVANRDQVLAFRLDSHNLATRLPRGAIIRAAGACGIQNTPPGSAALSLHARVAGIGDIIAGIGDLTAPLRWIKRCCRHGAYEGLRISFRLRMRPSSRQGCFPGDEESLRFFISGAEPALDRMGMSATEAVRLTAMAVRDALDDRIMVNKQLLDTELARRVSLQLTPEQLEHWQSPSWYGPVQRLGEAIVSFALRPVSLQGLICFAPLRGNQVSFACTDRWLGAALPEADHDWARAEPVRRYLHCYGPSTADHFAEWAGIAPAQAAMAWRLVEHELAEVQFEGRKAWLLKGDVPGLMLPRAPEGVLFLPPHDPYLQMRDRSTLIPNKALQRQIWRHADSPGIVISFGRPVAAWRGRKKGKLLNIMVELFASITQELRAVIEAEAATLAPLKGCTSIDVTFKEPCTDYDL